MTNFYLGVFVSDAQPSAPVPALSPVLTGNLICFGAMALFALSFPLADVLLTPWGPLALIAVRNVLGLAVIFVSWRVIERRVAMAGLPWLRGVMIGGAGFGLGSTLLLVAQSKTDPVTISLVIAVMPLVAVAIEVLLDGRRLTAWFGVGLALVLIGGALATGERLSQAQVGPGVAIGILSTVVYSWGSRATVKGLPGLTPLTQTMLTTVGMAVFCVIVFALARIAGWQAARIVPLDMTQNGVLIIYAVLGLALSQVMWVTAVGRIGIGLASFHINAVPFYVMVILVAFGGNWNPQQVLGAGVVVAGVIISQKRRRDRLV